MGRRSIRQSGPNTGSDVEPVVTRVVRRAVQPIAPEEVERRFRERKLPPVLLILVSVVLWVLLFFVGRAVIHALA